MRSLRRRGPSSASIRFLLQAAFVFGECKTYAFGAVGRSARRIDPNDFGWQEAFGIVGDFYGQEDVFAQGEYVIGWYEQAAVF